MGSKADDPMMLAVPFVPRMFDTETAEPAEWNAFLQEHGYVVLRNFLEPETRKALIAQFWKDLLRACRKNAHLERGGARGSHASRWNIDRQDKDTWMSPERHAPLHIAQSDFFWALRAQPNIAKVYAAIFDVAPEDLCVSLDSYSLQMKGHPPTGLPLHDDQAAGVDDRSDMYSIQGAYNFFCVTPEDTGLVVVPGSHKRWKKRRAGSHCRHKSHFVMISGGEEDYAAMYAAARKLMIPANCFVLWNSKTLHGTTPGTRDRPPRIIVSNDVPAVQEHAEEAEEGSSEKTTADLGAVGAEDVSSSAAASEDSIDKDAARRPAPIGAAAAAAAAAVAPKVVNKLNRLTCFVAMLPKSLRPDVELEKKIAIYKSGGSSSHWANKGDCHPVNKTGPIRGAVEKNGDVPAVRLAMM